MSPRPSRNPSERVCPSKDYIFIDTDDPDVIYYYHLLAIQATDLNPPA